MMQVLFDIARLREGYKIRKLVDNGFQIARLLRVF